MKKALRLVSLLCLVVVPTFGQVNNPGGGSGGGITTLTLPLASTATVTSILNVSSTSATFTCAGVPGCGLSGLTPSGVVNVGQGLNNMPASCQGPAVVASTSGNTATLTGMQGTCATNASTNYTSTLGSSQNVMNLIPAQGNNTPGATPTQYANIFLDYDGHVNIQAIYNAALRSYLDIDTTGTAGLVDSVNPIAIFSKQYNAGGLGSLCIGTVPLLYPAVCPGTELVMDTGNGNLGQAARYGGVLGTAPATIAPTNATGSFTNAKSYPDGFAYVITQFAPNSLITPTAGTTNTSSLGTLYTAPGSNYTANGFYELKGVFICSANCANSQSVYVSVTYNDGLASRTLSTCGSPGGAGNIYAVCTATPTTAWNLTTNPSMLFDFPAIYLSGSQAISATVTTTNGGVAQPQYYLGYTLVMY